MTEKPTPDDGSEFDDKGRPVSIARDVWCESEDDMGITCDLRFGHDGPHRPATRDFGTPHVPANRP